MLFSDHACAGIIEHIAAEMKKELNTYLKTSDRTFSVLVDESTSLSAKTALIIYIRVTVDNEQCN